MQHRLKREDIINIKLFKHGGFHDIESFEKEFGDQGVPREVIQAMIDENMDQKARLPIDTKILLDKHQGDATNYVDNDLHEYTKKIRENAERDRRVAEQNRRDAERAREDARIAQNMANEEARRRERDVNDERSRRLHSDRFDLLGLPRLRLYNSYDSDSKLSRYLEKERLKQELKEELAEERRRKARQRELDNLWKMPKAKSPRSTKAQTAKSKPAKSKPTKSKSAKSVKKR